MNFKNILLSPAFAALLALSAYAATVEFGGGGADPTGANTFSGNNTFSGQNTFNEVIITTSVNGAAVPAYVANSNTGSSAYTILQIRNSNASLNNAELMRVGANNTAYGGANSFGMYADSSTDLFFVTNNIVRLFIQDNGAISVGSNITPVHLVEIASGTVWIGGTSAALRVDAGFRPWNRTTAQLAAITPGAAGETYFNSDLSSLCHSTGTTLASFVLARSTTTACD